MSDQRHEDLVENASRGERAALETLLERHLPGLLAYVRLHAGPLVLRRESCSDIVQSACREVLQKMDRFEYRGEPAFRKWLFVTALNKIRERHRYYQAAKRDVKREDPRGEEGRGDLAEILPAFVTPSQVAIAEEDMQRLERAFSQLSEEQRLVITLARIVGLAHAEIAEELGRSEGAVRVFLHRSLLRLGWLMDQDAEESGA